MRIYVNDQPKALSDAVTTVEELLTSMGVPAGGTAVAVNGKIVTKNQWSLKQLEEGDRVMVISAAYGG